MTFTVIHGHPNEDEEANQMSLMVMQFGQFLDHDITLTLESNAEDCCTNSGPYGRMLEFECFPISIPDMDPTFGSLG